MLKKEVKLMLEDHFDAKASDIFIANLINVIQTHKEPIREFVLRRTDINKSDIEKLEKEQLEGSLSYLKDLAGIESYSEDDEIEMHPDGAK